MGKNSPQSAIVCDAVAITPIRFFLINICDNIFIFTKLFIDYFLPPLTKIYAPAVM